MNKFSFVGKNNNKHRAYVEVIMNKNKRKKLDGEKIFSIVATLAITAALVVGIVTIVKSIGKTNDKNRIDLNEAMETTSHKENETDFVADNVTEAPSKTIKPSNEATTAPPVEEVVVTEPSPTLDVNASVYNFGESSSLLWPVEGEIVLGYNMENTIYFPTLNQYQCNPAIVISADIDTEVLSAAKGVVEDVYEDPVIGTTMVISIGNGYKLVYGQLKDLAVGISEEVDAGTVLGKVSKPTKYYAVEGSNLYFSLLLEDEPVDPTIFLIGNE